MRICEDCKLTLNDSDLSCPNCGKNTLVIDPNNAGSAAAVGRIYEERGMLDEAAVWYRMALDRDPAELSYQTSLSRTNALIAARGRIAPKKSPTGSGITKTHIIVLAASLTVLLIALIVFLVSSASKKPSNTAFTEKHSQTAVSRVSTVEHGPTAPSSPSATSSRNAPLAGEESSATHGTRTAGETAINSALQQSDTVRATGARIDDVIADPRQGVVTVTLVLPASGSVNEDIILRAAATVAKTAVTSNNEVKFVTARVLLSSGDAKNTQITFIGDAARSSLEAMSENPNASQLRSIFTNPWWIKNQAGVSR